ncbi:porin family protein [Bradyrhizobium sp. WSM 1704]|uniref:outer membrane protein n=1 Tax=Bradyrhizobium semiaridum TaxID=2821404 RepID=UPI001CE25DAF|nr:outer membrane beta-barrel protein [Bradyrhizobium semiaridum]MCA6120456.1 porin family protein [Bradyrhizobium semiaridum]
MKQLLVAAAGLAALGVSSATAADLAVRPAKVPVVTPAMTWEGFYLGAQGGGGWGRSKETYLGAPNDPAFIGTQSYTTSGGFVGGVVGYNWQAGPAVFGLEGDYHWSDINGRSAIINVGPPNVLDTYYTALRSFGDIKGRLGYADGPALWFVSGGAAVGDIQHRYSAGLAPPSFAASQMRWGWTAGAGVEYMFAPNWSAKAEYNYIDLGKAAPIQYTADPTDRSEWRDTFHTVKVGLNYHFNWSGPVVAKY